MRRTRRRKYTDEKFCKRLIGIVLISSLVISSGSGAYLPISNDLDALASDEKNIQVTYSTDSGFNLSSTYSKISNSFEATLDTDGYYQLCGDDSPSNIRLKEDITAPERMVAVEKLELDICDVNSFDLLKENYGFSDDSRLIVDLRTLGQEVEDDSTHIVTLYIGEPSKNSPLSRASVYYTYKGYRIREDTIKSSNIIDKDGGTTILTVGERSQDTAEGILSTPVGFKFSQLSASDFSGARVAFTAVAKKIGSILTKLTISQLNADMQTAGTSKPYIRAFTNRIDTTIYTYVVENNSPFLGCRAGSHNIDCALHYFRPGSTNVYVQGSQNYILSSPLYSLSKQNERFDKAIVYYPNAVNPYEDIPAYTYLGVKYPNNSVKNFQKFWPA